MFAASVFLPSLTNNDEDAMIPVVSPSPALVKLPTMRSDVLVSALCYLKSS
jgi:hypothetical protein